jgi:predicted negative regulator of RcsB-dependent stress response
MAKKSADTQEELEQLTATEGFFDKNKKILFIVGGAIVVLVLGFVTYQKAIIEPRITDSQDEYWNAFYEYQYNDSTELAYEGNDNFLGFEDLSSSYNGTPAGEIASYGMATHAMEKGEFEDALSYLEECDFEDIVVGTLVLGMMGDCYVEMGDFEAAIEKFEEAVERQPNEFTTPMFLKKVGMVYEEIGDNELAVSSYQKIKDDWSESLEAADIDKYIARAQG